MPGDDERGVVPRQLRQRLRQLLQPGVVGEAAVVDARVGPEDDLEALRLRREPRRQRALRLDASPASARTRCPAITPSCSHLRHARSNGDGATGAAVRPVAGGAAGGARCGCRRLRAGCGPAAPAQGAGGGARRPGRQPAVGPELAHQVVAGALGRFAERGEHFVRRLAAVERRDQRLHDRHRAVVGADVAPRLEEVRFRDVPVAERGGLVLVAARGARAAAPSPARRRTSDRPVRCRPGCRRGSAGSSTVPAFISPTSSLQAGELVRSAALRRSACRRPSRRRCRARR